MSYTLRTTEPTDKRDVLDALRAAVPDGDEPVSDAQLHAVLVALPGLLAEVGAPADQVLVEVIGHDAAGIAEYEHDAVLYVAIRTAVGVNNGPQAEEYAALASLTDAEKAELAALGGATA